MAGYEFGHLKHRYFALSSKNRLQLGISKDVPLVLGILKVILLYIDPYLLNDLTARHRTLAYDCLELRREVHWLQQCRIGFSNHIMCIT